MGSSWAKSFYFLGSSGSRSAGSTVSCVWLPSIFGAPVMPLEPVAVPEASGSLLAVDVRVPLRSGASFSVIISSPVILDGINGPGGRLFERPLQQPTRKTRRGLGWAGEGVPQGLR